MIEKRLYRSLGTIINDVDTDIRDYYQLFSYGKEVVDDVLQAKNLITYREETKQAWGKGRKVLEDNGSSLIYKTYSDFKISVVLDFFGEDAEEQIISLQEVLNNNDDNFFENDLGVLSYGTIQNLSFLENSKFKQRYSIEILFKFVYNKENEEGYNIETAEFDLIKET